jgi:hypothetical protein
MILPYRPAWHAAHVEKLTRKARTGPCPGCGAPTMHGLDGDRCALLVRVDAEPVDVTTALLGSLKGRHAYTLAGGELVALDRLNLSRPDQELYLDHECEGK